MSPNIIFKLLLGSLIVLILIIIALFNAMSGHTAASPNIIVINKLAESIKIRIKAPIGYKREVLTLETNSATEFYSANALYGAPIDVEIRSIATGMVVKNISVESTNDLPKLSSPERVILIVR